MKFLLFVLTVSIFLYANTNERALYVKKYKNESKTALVIGNGNYRHFSNLKNATNDANDIKDLLKSKGFKVYHLQNATLRKMDKTIKRFIRDIKYGGVGMVYFAGHGVEVDGQNYLVPVDTQLGDKSDLKYDALSVNKLIDKIENANNRLNILVLDACRNDPFSRSGGGGLAAINNAKGMYVAYATAPGEVASDGTGSNGLFTKHLLNEIKEEQTLEKVFKNTRSKVYNESNGKQIPWTSSSVMGEFYFSLPKKIEYQKATKNIGSKSKEDVFWEFVQEDGTFQYYKEYLKKFPNGKYKQLAKEKLKKTKKSKVQFVSEYLNGDARWTNNGAWEDGMEQCKQKGMKLASSKQLQELASFYSDDKTQQKKLLDHYFMTSDKISYSLRWGVKYDQEHYTESFIRVGCIKENQKVTFSTDEAKSSKKSYYSKPKMDKNFLEGKKISKNCSMCHGKNFERKALGKSKIVQNMSEKDIYDALLGYKIGVYGGGFRGVMRSQARSYSDEQLKNVAMYISSIK